MPIKRFIESFQQLPDHGIPAAEFNKTMADTVAEAEQKAVPPVIGAEGQPGKEAAPDSPQAHAAELGSLPIEHLAGPNPAEHGPVPPVQ